MGFYISVIGIDGSGKSMVTLALADLIAAELGLTTVAVSDDFWGKTPDEDLFRPGFKPDGEPLVARLDRLARKGAKATTYNRRLYPTLKVAQLAMQELAARRLDINYRPDVILGDGNLLLTSGGWAINYMGLRPDSTRHTLREEPPAYADALYDYVTQGQPLPPAMGQPIAGLKLMRWLHGGDQQLKLGLTKLPDALILLDIEPQTALARVLERAIKPDGHENIDDMSQARTMLQGVADFFRRRRGTGNVAVIDVTGLSVGQTLAQVLDFVRSLPLPQRRPPRSESKRLYHQDRTASPEQRRLGSARTKLTNKSVMLRKAFTFQYLFRCALPNLHRGIARELTFPLSSLGRLSLREGYSARLMKAIYLQDKRKYGLLDRVFLGHPLHKAVFHRLGVLKRVIERELWYRLVKLPTGDQIKVMTAPSGYAFDLLQPLTQMIGTDRAIVEPIYVLAADLDPDGRIEQELSQAAQNTGLGFEFLRGDMTSIEMREQFKRLGPYDLVMFVGLSSWISKTHLLDHLKLVGRHMLAPGGVLITDCFTPQVSAVTGKYVGYKANYYSPAEFSSLLAYSGFDPAEITWESGPQGIDHVCIART